MSFTTIAALVGICIMVLVNWDIIQKLFQNINTKKESDIIVPPPIQTTPEIHQIVEQWKILKEMCIKAKLNKSAESLKEVFSHFLDESQT